MNYKLYGFLVLQAFVDVVMAAFRLYHNNSNIIKKLVSANQISFQIAIFCETKKVRYEVKHEM